MTSGGIGGNHELVRKNWPRAAGHAAAAHGRGVPDHVDGRMLEITEPPARRIINRDRMWHYIEGIAELEPDLDRHGIRILPGPVVDLVRRDRRAAAVPLFPGFDTLGTLEASA